MMQSPSTEAATGAFLSQQPRQDSPQVKKYSLAPNCKSSISGISTKAVTPTLPKSGFSFLEKPWQRTEEAFTLWLLIVGVTCFILGIIARMTSLIWHLFIVLVSAWMIFRHTRRNEVKQLVREVLSTEDLWHNQDFIKYALREIPSWVNSPDWEQGKFVQKAVQQAWPAARKLIDVMLRTHVVPLLKKVKPKFLHSINLADINLGSKWPEIQGIKNVGNSHEEGIILDIRLATWPANVSLLIEALSGVGLTVGLRDLSVKGTFRIVLAPLVGNVPFIGGIRIGFAEKPEVLFELHAGGMGLKIIPGLEDFLENLVSNLIEWHFCWPNDLFIPLLHNLKLCDNVRKPKGLLEITPLKARGLVHKTKMKMLQPDPYCVVTIHAKKQKTKKAHNTSEPDWDDVPMEFIIMDLKNSVANITVFNATHLGKDKNMGHCKVNFREGWNLEKEEIQTKWIPLLGTSSGEVLVKIKWNGYSSIKVSQKLPVLNIKPLKRTAATELLEKGPKDLPSKGVTSTLNKYSGLLTLIIKNAEGLAAGDVDGFSDPFVNIELHTATKSKKNQTFNTAVKKQTLSPSWDEIFNVKISDYNKAILELTVLDWDKFGKNDRLGDICLPVKDIVKNNCMVNAWYPLQNGKGKINISANFIYEK